MIESIRFQNFKCLRDTTLPLSPCTVIVGPNGSGKSTVLQTLEALKEEAETKKCQYSFKELVTARVQPNPEVQDVELCVKWGEPCSGVELLRSWHRNGVGRAVEIRPTQEADRVRQLLARIRVYSLNASAIADPIALQREIELAPDGAGLAGVLDRLRDQEPERFETLNNELRQWFPEYDRVGLDVNVAGKRLFFLETRDGGYRFPASALSQGTLLALTMLTLTYLPERPCLIGLEEPDRGIHPRLLNHVQEAIYRLSHPESFGESREPVQVIATTHSPYFVDLFKDHPEEIVIANKVGLDVQFQRLSDQPNIKEIISDAPLGEAWFTGVLGGVPSTP